MRKSTNYGLKLMEGTDNVKRQDFIDNFEIIDKELKNNSIKVDNIKIADASTSQKGIVQLNNTVNSISVTEAATANAVKTAYDKGNEALNKANQAFQYASNGKNLIAGKVGNVNGNNTHAEIANRVQADKNTMANNLNSKGVGANGNEALASLASKIGNITTAGYVLGSGKTSTGRGAYQKHEMTINVGFKPSAVLIYDFDYQKDERFCDFIMFNNNFRITGALPFDKFLVTDTGFYTCDTWNNDGGETFYYVCFK